MLFVLFGVSHLFGATLSPSHKRKGKNHYGEANFNDRDCYVRGSYGCCYLPDSFRRIQFYPRWETKFGRDFGIVLFVFRDTSVHTQQNAKEQRQMSRKCG